MFRISLLFHPSCIHKYAYCFCPSHILGIYHLLFLVFVSADTWAIFLVLNCQSLSSQDFIVFPNVIQSIRFDCSCSIYIRLHQCFWICGVHTDSYISLRIFDVILFPEIEIVHGVPGTGVVLIRCRPESTQYCNASLAIVSALTLVFSHISSSSHSFSSSMCPPTCRMDHLIDEISSWCLMSIKISYELHVELTVVLFIIAVTASTAPLQSHASWHSPCPCRIPCVLQSRLVNRMPPRIPPSSAR